MKIHSKIKEDLDYLKVYENMKRRYFNNERLIENYVSLQDGHHGVIIEHDDLIAMKFPRHQKVKKRETAPIDLNKITSKTLPNDQTFSKVLLLQTVFYDNYCHNLIDNIPTILYHDKHSNADVIYTPESKLLSDQLKHHNIKLNKTMLVNPDETVSFNSQAVCCINCTPGAARHRKKIVNFIDDCVNHSVNCKSTTNIKNRLIYATRNYSDSNLQIRRKIQDDNELEIVKLLKYFCDNNNLIFTMFDGYKNGKRMTLSEQSKLFNEAKMVVGPHGGAMSNIVYLDPNNNPIVCEFTGGTQSPVHANSVFGKNYSNLYTSYFEEIYDYSLIPFTDDSSYDVVKIDIDNLKQFLKL
jgi:hypothetical protein